MCTGIKSSSIYYGCYFRRIWRGLGIDKITQVHKGVFLVRFHNEKNKIKVAEDDIQMFDRKLIVVKP